MEMQDKEFDELFRSKLDSFEVQPSKKAWQNITGSLGQSRSKKKLASFLSMAASIIVLIAAGMLFIGHKAGIDKPQPLKNETATIARPLRAKAVANIPAKPENRINQKRALLAVNQPTVPHQKKRGLKIIAVNTVRNMVPQVVPAITQTQIQPANELAENKKNITRPTFADSAVLVAVKPPANPKPKQALLAALPPLDEPVIEASAKKHRIRSFGDILNVMIAAVDKRPDKIVEFSDTDGDEASITEINLGVIKIKKEN